MISNQTDYRKAMCKMIRKIQNSSSAEEINDLEMSIEDAEILNDCIENGFVRGKTTYRNHNGEEIELRTMDGKAHSEIFNTVITLKGLEFLKPDRTKTKANLAIIISAIAGVVSLGSLLVSVLANLDKIISNLEILNDLLF